MIIVVPEWLLYMSVALSIAWALSTLLLLWIWFREWCATVGAMATGKAEEDTDKLQALPVGE